MTATAGVKTLRKVQLGRETTPGTSVATTSIWRGPAVMPQDDVVKTRPEENVGLSSLTTRQYTPSKLASLAFPATPATFQQILHPFEGGIKAVTPSADGVGSGKIWAYPLPSGDSNTVKTYTLQGGDQKVVEQVEYAFAREIEISGKKNEAIMMTSSWQGRQATVSAFSGGATRPSVSELLFNLSKIYIDGVGGTIGTTQLVNSLIEFKLKITTGLKAQFSADGNLYFSYMDFVGAKCTLEMTLLHNASVAAERVLWRSDTPRLIRLQTEGKSLTTPGTTYSKETFRADLAGVYTQFGPANDEDEGTNAIKVVFECGYDTTAAKFVDLLVVNELASVP